MEKRLIMGVILLAGFITAVSGASMYAQSRILSGTVCGCEFPVELLIPLLSSAGVLIGSLVYYFMSEPGRKGRDLSPILSLLDYDRKIIVEALAKNGGSMPQSKLVSSTGMNKVKVSRVVADLETKGVLRKSTCGVTNLVELENNIKKILV